MRALLILCLALLSAPSFACKGVQVIDGWIRQAPPGAHVMAGYVELKNTGTRSRVIQSITSPAFGAIEIHQTIIKDGESRMLALDDLEIPAHGTIRLEPGGVHLMLFRPRDPQPKLDDQTVLSFACAKGKPIKATFTVKAAE